MKVYGGYLKSISNKKTVLILFFLPLAGFLLSSEFLARYIEEITLIEKLNDIEKYLNERSNHVNKIIKSQIDNFNYDCGYEDAQLIRNSDIYNRYFRLIGIKTDSGNGCSSLGPDFNFSDNPNFKYQKSGFTITATSDFYNTEKELLIYKKQKNNTIYWVLDSSWANEILNEKCKFCFYLEFVYHNREQKLSFNRGNNSILNEKTINKKSLFISNHNVDINIFSGKKLNGYVVSELYKLGIPLSLLLGIISSIFYLIYKNYSHSLRSLIIKGINNGEFIPFYQPIFDIKQQKIVGYEILIRWKQQGKFLPPNFFIDYAESTGLILPITEKVMCQVLENMHKLCNNQWVSVNLVASHLEKSHLKTYLEKSNWPERERLKFELTERHPIKDINYAKSEISELSKLGYNFKIDDFGTGYGGFKYIQSLGIKSIKIDKMFIDTIGTENLKLGVLDTIIDFGLKYDMEIIAEGIENEEQLTYLSERGVFLFQGYYFSKPLPFDEIKNIIFK